MCEVGENGSGPCLRSLASPPTSLCSLPLPFHCLTSLGRTLASLYQRGGVVKLPRRAWPKGEEEGEEGGADGDASPPRVGLRPLAQGASGQFPVTRARAVLAARRMYGTESSPARVGCCGKEETTEVCFASLSLSLLSPGQPHSPHYTPLLPAAALNSLHQDLPAVHRRLPTPVLPRWKT